MNITELANYRLSDAIKFHDRLNPRLWDSSEHLHPAVKDKLLQIAADFQEFLGVPDLDVKDITVSGSNAAYNYTPTSDIDLHLIVDLPQADRSEVFRELFDAKKYQYNEQHNITIGGYDVELYVQDPRQEHHSQGIYSLLKNNWVSVPKRRKPEIDDVSVRSKAEDIAARIDDAVKSKNYQRIVTLHKKIKTLRQSGLEQQGEYGSDNLAFKVLRNQGYIKKLIDARNAAKDAELSLQERKKKKKKVRYGFGGYWAPGFSFGDAGESGGGDGGGGESMREDNTGMSQGSAIGDTGAQSTWDGVSPDTQEFLSETDDHENIVQDFIQDTAKKLGIADLPRIEMHRDPKWSQQNKSFGMYKPDLHELHVSLSNRHLLDILRTTAHELAHCAQNQHETLPNDAGDTGSEYENQAHAIAGIVMRDYADSHPELFMRQEIEEGTMSRAGAAAALAAAMAMTPAQAQEYLPPEQQPQVQQQGQLNPVQVLNVARTLYRLKHNVTRAGAEEELNQEFKNYIRAHQGDPGAQNLSRLWQMQQRRQQAQQPQQPWTGNQYQREAVQEASGYIPTAAEKNDPRFQMALSPDVQPGATGKNANKMSLKTDSQGRPGLLMKTVNLREGKIKDLNDPLGPESPPTMPAGTVRIDVSDMYDWYKLGQHISNMKGLGRHDFGAGPPSSVISFGDEETEHKFIKDLEATGLDVTDIDPKDPAQPPGMRKIKTDPTYNVDEGWKDVVAGGALALSALGAGAQTMPNMHAQQVELTNKYYNALLQRAAQDGRTLDARTKNFLMAKAQDAAAQKLQQNKPQSQTTFPSQGSEKRVAKDINQFESQDIVENDIVESLRQEFALLEDEFIGEIKMSPKNLRQEAAKTGAMAGMEFEMIVPNARGEPPEPDYEPDYDQDESVRDIDDAVQFFDDGDYNSRRDVVNLREEMQGQYYEWLDERKQEKWEEESADYIRDWLWGRYEDDWREQAEDAVLSNAPEFGANDQELRDQIEDMVRERHDEVTEDVLANLGSDYDEAYDEWSEDFNANTDMESEWLASAGIETMRDVAREFDIQWPHWYDSNAGSEGDTDINDVADEFSRMINKPVNASERYHGARREPGHYVVEPDGSLDPDNSEDAGLEFVSPPMPIDELLSDLNKIKKWAGTYGCYTNDSTGLHINISVPNYDVDQLDYVKLALLMGDEYVLKAFGRTGNIYTKSAMGKIKDVIRNKPQAAEALLAKMKGHMGDLATKAIHSGTTEKYTSINTKSGYIEFRSPGGDWLDDNFDKIESTLLRFTVALSAAMDPDAYRQEYLKKLYKLLTPDGDNDPIAYFARYAAGELDKSDLRKFIKQVQLQRNVVKGKQSGKMWWQVSRPGYFASIEVVAASKEEAIDKAIEPDNYPDWARARDSLQVKPLRPYVEPQSTSQPTGGNLSQTDIENRLGWGSQSADANYEIVYRASNPPQRRFVFIANTPQEAQRKYTDWLAAQGLPAETEDYGFREIARPGSTLDLQRQRAAAAQSTDTAQGGLIDVPIEIPDTAPRTLTTPGQPQPLGAGREFVGWKIVDPQGRTIHEFSGIGNAQGSLDWRSFRDANAFAINWLRNNPRHMQAGVEVVPNWREA